ncbi:LTA synthase family protein [Carnobacterium pleistocenium]|uniref:LTA synthase family protein n=1 Tax=Carnobacterium pleistocenium TaxID=181073 RepID=UPI000552C4F3|nr:LTA synthase family protein [Carnobacterium pleistocenium]
MEKISRHKTSQSLYKESSILINSLITILIGLIIAFFGNFLLQFFQNQYDFSLAVNFTFYWNTEIFLLGALLLFLLYLWIAALVGSRWLSVLIMTVIIVAMGVTTQQKMALRGEPLYPSDLLLISDLPFLIQMVDSKLILVVIIFLISVVSLSTYIIIKKRKRDSKYLDTAVKKKMNWLVRGSTFFITSAVLFYSLGFNQPDNILRQAYDRYAYWIPYSQQMNYYNNGFIGGFLYNIGVEAMEKPADYSKKQLTTIVQKYEEKASEINENRSAVINDVNIIYVMNESFSDPLALDGITVSEDPIPRIRSLKEEVVSGTILSQGYGGGTANIEFEALTGLSMEPMSASLTTPYTQLVSRMSELPSAVSYLKQQGYKATAIHPYNTTMYKRNEVYQNLGFTTFLNETNMEFLDKKEQNPYISDESAYQEVLKQMESTNESDFIHLVTMQNHMIYDGKYPDTDFSAQGTGNAEEAANYLQDLAYSDVALADFLTTVEQLPEKTIVVFWGDHLPSFYSETIIETNGNLKIHQTPLLIYSNFTENNDTVETISPIYFMNHILDISDAQVTAFYALLMELEEALPAFEKGMYIERDSTIVSEKRNELSKETQELLKVYDAIQYDVTVGENYSKALNFFED